MDRVPSTMQENLEENLRSLLDRAKSGQYRNPAVKRYQYQRILRQSTHQGYPLCRGEGASTKPQAGVLVGYNYR